MAYFSQDRKKAMAPKMKSLLKQYGMKGTLAVRDHMTVVLNLREGPIDFGGTQVDVNTYWVREHFEGIAREFLLKALDILHEGNHDNSDIQTDYFDVGWYVNIKVGKWNKPYNMVG